MFEKEAEEYKDTYFGFADERISEVQDFEGNYIDISERIMKTFIDGAEFGYNKANEWHYVKDGDLPTHSYRVLVFTDEGVGFGIYGLDDKKWHTYDTGFDVIAWKEIVFPKESE